MTAAGSTIDVMAYDNNEIDVAAVNPIELIRIKSDPKLGQELSTFDQYTTFYAFFRTREPPFDDLPRPALGDPSVSPDGRLRRVVPTWVSRQSSRRMM